VEGRINAGLPGRGQASPESQALRSRTARAGQEACAGHSLCCQARAGRRALRHPRSSSIVFPLSLLARSGPFAGTSSCFGTLELVVISVLDRYSELLANFSHSVFMKSHCLTVHVFPRSSGFVFYFYFLKSIKAAYLNATHSHNTNLLFVLLTSAAVSPPSAIFM
jgi:hypothetical protein